MKIAGLVALVAVSLAGNAGLSAGQRTSANYNIVADTADAGGQRVASANYANVGTAGGVAGISTSAAPVVAAKHGYAGQLYDITALALSAVMPAVDEGATLQLGAWQTLDDATFLTVPSVSVLWSVAGGPLMAIDASGLATADLVYQDTVATAQGLFAGNTGTLDLTVKNVNPDDFGLYAGDGLGDDWQVQYFGLDNPLAAPLLDPDGDGQTNLFEYTAGLVPTDANSIFRLRIESAPGQPGQKNLIFSPRLPDRTYTAKARPSLLDGIFSPLDSFSFVDDGEERTLTDLDATGLTKFYTVEITKP